MNIPIFDSNCHPTIDGSWMGKSCNNSIFEYVKKSREANFIGACITALPNTKGWPREEHVSECTKYNEFNLLPIAAIDPLIPNIHEEIKGLAKLGFRGVKIHPRLSNIIINEHKELLIDISKALSNANLTFHLCTYNHSKVNLWPTVDPLVTLAEILKLTPDTKYLLLHGGTVRLLEYAELVRFNDNILLDLSYTINHWAESSLDMDIRFLMKTLDQRICLGSDSPEFNPIDLRRRFEYLSDGLAINKLENIAYKNIKTFFNI